MGHLQRSNAARRCYHGATTSGKPTSEKECKAIHPDSPISYEPVDASVHDDATDSQIYSLLGGRVFMRAQPGRDRPAVDAMLLAAAAPLRSAVRVLDAGCGSGAVGLCAAVRSRAATISAVDVSADAIDETSANVAGNGWQKRFDIHQSDLSEFKDPDGFDLVLSNPPYHDQSSSRSPQHARDQARFGVLSLQDWLAHCFRLCKPRGRIVVILRADRIAQALATLEGLVGDLRILPIHARGGAYASRVLIHGRKAVATQARLLSGLVLHEADGSWTEPVRRILRDGAGIDWERGEVVG